MEAAHQMAEAGRQLGYSEDHEVIQLAKKEYAEAAALRQTYQNAYNTLIARWAEKEKEYPAATYIWNYFKELGYSNEVIAGLLGNMMCEVGGNTLDIQWNLGTSHYGICQWSVKTYSIWGASLEQQCKFLDETLEEEMNTFGSVYKRGFGYDDFMALTDVESVAKSFAMCYERCSTKTYKTRQRNAIIAYNYFVS
jgi:hypothetical protein